MMETKIVTVFINGNINTISRFRNGSWNGYYICNEENKYNKTTLLAVRDDKYILAQGNIAQGNVLFGCE